MRHRNLYDVGKQHASLATKRASRGIKAQEMIEPAGLEQHAAIVEADVAIAPPIAAGDARLAKSREWRIPVE